MDIGVVNEKGCTTVALPRQIGHLGLVAPGSCAIRVVLPRQAYKITDIALASLGTNQYSLENVKTPIVRDAILQAI